MKRFKRTQEILYLIEKHHFEAKTHRISSLFKQTLIYSFFLSFKKLAAGKSYQKESKVTFFKSYKLILGFDL